MRTNTIIAGVLFGAAGLLVAPTAFALNIGDTVTRNVEHAVGFEDQIALGNAATFAGVDLSVLFSFTRDTATTATFTADVTNISTSDTAIMGAIGIDMADALSFATGSFSFTAGNCTVDAGGCNYEFSANGGLNGFGNVIVIDIAATNTNPGGGINNGLKIGEDGLFSWGVEGDAAFLDGVGAFLDAVSVTTTTETVLHGGGTGNPINAFWMAHMQSITCEDCPGSIKIGGGALTDIAAPEPGTIALFGVGLLGLGAAARYRRKAA